MKPHGFLVYLPAELYVAIVKLQADKGLGRVFPVLYSINEGLFKLGYITKEVYETYEKAYSKPLTPKEGKPPTLQELRKQEKLEQLEKHFSDVLKQWPRLNEKAKAFHMTKARKYVNKVTNAKLVLALTNDGAGPNNSGSS